MKVFAYEKYQAMNEARTPGHGRGYSKPFMVFIGVCEIVGGLGLILPLALGIAPVLTPLAALGLAIIMVGAAAFHVQRKEPPIPAVVCLVLCCFVVYGRW